MVAGERVERPSVELMRLSGSPDLPAYLFMVCPRLDSNLHDFRSKRNTSYQLGYEGELFGRPILSRTGTTNLEESCDFQFHYGPNNY